MSRETRKKRIMKVSVCAMLIGISTVIGALCREFLTFGIFIRVTFENLPIILAGLLFGPAYGLAVGVSTDLISSLVTGQEINPIITFGALAVGFCAGIAVEMCDMLSAKPFVKRLSACFVAHFMGNLIIKTFGLKLYYFPDTSFWYLFGIRAAVYSGIFVVEFIIITLLLKNTYIKRFSSYEL